MGDSTESLSKSEAEALKELEAEFQRELERNAMAVRLLQQKAEEAKQAKLRADLSQKKMESMQEKYTHMQVKVETTKKTLNEAQDRIVRQDKIQETVKNLQERAQVYAEKMTQRQESSALFCAEIADFDFPQPLINYEEDDVKEGSIESTGSSSCSEHQQLRTDSSTDHVTSLDQSEKPVAESEDDEDLQINLESSVERLEAKCAGVREELGRMALSEQYMRTKQAQLFAKRREMEAKQAMLKAEIKEKEAAEMRKKVAEMMNLLAQRRNKLKVTNEVIDKKSDVVEKVKEEKILTAKVLDRKERRANYLTKQREEQIAFGKKQAKK